MREKCYIASKVSGNPTFREDFAHAEKVMTLKGYDVVSPICAITEEEAQEKFGDIFSRRAWCFFMSKGVKKMCDCDVVCMFGDWESSEGARTEHYIACKIGKRVLYYNTKWEEYNGAAMQYQLTRPKGRDAKRLRREVTIETMRRHVKAAGLDNICIYDIVRELMRDYGDAFGNAEVARSGVRYLLGSEGIDHLGNLASDEFLSAAKKTQWQAMRQGKTKRKNAVWENI